MATFYTDADLAGNAQFVESELLIGGRFTVGAGTIVPRWRWPNNTPGVTPMAYIYTDAGALVAGPIAFDTTTLTAWNLAGAASPVAVSAGTYDVAVNTTHYMALSGFFAGGPIVRGDVTGVSARFGNTGAAPPNSSTATYYVDIDFTPAGAGAVTPTSIPLLARLGQPMVSNRLTVTPAPVPLAVRLGQVIVTTPPPEPAAPSTGGWNGLLAVRRSADADHRQNVERERHPIDCPEHGWPLVPSSRGLHCEFGGHVVTPRGF